MVSNFKEPKVRSEKHRRFIASLPCCVTGLEGSTQAAHIRTGCGAGMGLKSSDEFCLPLSVREHQKQHATSEEKYWGDHLMDAVQLAVTLYAISGDNDRARQLVDQFRWKMVGSWSW